MAAVWAHDMGRQVSTSGAAVPGPDCSGATPSSQVVVPPGGSHSQSLRKPLQHDAEDLESPRAKFEGCFVSWDCFKNRIPQRNPFNIFGCTTGIPCCECSFGTFEDGLSPKSCQAILLSVSSPSMGNHTSKGQAGHHPWLRNKTRNIWWIHTYDCHSETITTQTIFWHCLNKDILFSTSVVLLMHIAGSQMLL